VLDHELPRAPAHAGAVDPRGSEPAVLRDLDRREQPGAVRAEAIDISLRQAGVGERAADRLEVELERCLDIDPTAVGQRRADNADRASAQRSFQSIRLPLSNSF
jgi:hypothetical protein